MTGVKTLERLRGDLQKPEHPGKKQQVEGHGHPAAVYPSEEQIGQYQQRDGADQPLPPFEKRRARHAAGAAAVPQCQRQVAAEMSARTIRS